MTTKAAIELYVTNGKRLLHCRKQNKISLRDLETETGVHYCSINRFEHHKPITALHYIQLMDWLMHHERVY